MITRRILFSVPAAMSMTFGLLLLMQLMISTGRTVIEPVEFFETELLTIRQEVPVEKSVERIKPPPPVEPPPDPPPMQHDIEPATIQIARVMPPVDPPGPNLQPSVLDGAMWPIFRVTPIYPMRAVTRGLEGYVVVEFTVTRTGAVTNIVVIESSNTVFNKAAIAAVGKFKYRPRVVAGQPVKVPGVQFKLTFEFDD